MLDRRPAAGAPLGARKTHYATVFHLGGRGGLPGSGPAGVLHSGWSATTYMQWWNWCRKTRPAIVLVLPRKGGTMRLHPQGAPRCDAPAKVTTLVVTPFRKAELRPGAVSRTASASPTGTSSRRMKTTATSSASAATSAITM